MLFSILIPTYNRSEFLVKNLNILKSHIAEFDSSIRFEIVISNNCSTDATDIAISEFIRENPKIDVNYIRQTSNLGVAMNCLIVFKESQGDYVMYLGDDDFISSDYLNNLLNHLINNPETHSVIPSILEIDIHGQKAKEGRDHELKSRIHSAGYSNCLENAWRGHQLSGIVVKRNNLYENYPDKDRGNMYIFIYFLAMSTLSGSTYHLTEFPVMVTNPGQKKKDWSYGEDGLLNEIFDNYINLPLNSWQITKLQLKVIESQPWRLWKYKKVGYKEFLITFKNMWFSKNSTYLFKIAFPLLVLKIAAKKKLYKLLKS